MARKKRNGLVDLDINKATPRRDLRKKTKTMYPAGGHTRIADEVRSNDRLPPPVPKNKSLAEIHAMDPEDPQFRHPQGHPRKWTGDESDDELSWRDIIRRNEQLNSSNPQRAKIRKYEAEVMKAKEILEQPSSGNDLEVYDEDRALAEGILTFDDWDDEELVRGFRRNRSGNFGRPPKFIPREVQQEAFRRLVHRGEGKLRGAYIKTIDNLIDLAHSSTSDKVRLEAQKELLNRVVGKVPDRMMIATDAPWQDMLADSLVPVADVPPIDMELSDDGVAYVPPVPELAPGLDDLDIATDSGPRGVGGVETRSSASGRRDPDEAPPPTQLSPSGPKKSKRARAQVKAKAKTAAPSGLPKDPRGQEKK